jgi:hypothetical protein
MLAAENSDKFLKNYTFYISIFDMKVMNAGEDLFIYRKDRNG